MKRIKKEKAGITIGFGKGRLFEETIEKFSLPRTPAFMEFCTSRLPIYENADLNVTCVTARHVDLAWLLEKGHIDVAIGSGLWFLNTTNTEFKKFDTLETKPYRLALISEKGVALDDIKKVVTRFDVIAKNFFEEKGMDVEIISMNGCHEIALTLGFADAIIDVIETGRTIKKMGFHELESIADLGHEIWLRDDANFERNSMKLESLMTREYTSRIISETYQAKGA